MGLSLYWEEIPGQKDRKILQRQLEEAKRQNIPIRLVRATKRDGNRVQAYEWYVREKDCVIQGCTVKASNVIVSSTDETWTEIAMCDYHYDDFNSEESLDKPFNMKDNVYSKYK